MLRENRGSFKGNPERAAEAGRKGGQISRRRKYIVVKAGDKFNIINSYSKRPIGEPWNLEWVAQIECDKMNMKDKK